MRNARRHLTAVTRPVQAQSSLILILDSLANLMGTILVRQRQSAWKTPFPQVILEPPDNGDA